MKICTQCQRKWEDAHRFCPIDGIPLQEAPAGPDPLAGKMIGKVRLVEKIANGDLGAVYKAEDPVRGAVAIQVLPRDRITSSILLEAFGDAVGLATKLNHPNVIRVYGMETGADGSIGVGMELVSGVSLQDYYRSHPAMEPAEACRLVKQAADGVVAAHRLSMLHAALHPGRILVTRDGLVKIGGFHRSGLREGADPASVTQGNLPYLAPEQLGIIQDVQPDYRMDIYSLGVILYELLCGRLPYDVQTVQELSRLVHGANPPGPAFVNPKVAAPLSRVVTTSISPHPQERQGSMEQFARELESVGQPPREPARPLSPQTFGAPEQRPSENYDLFPSEPHGKEKPGVRFPKEQAKREAGRDLWSEAGDGRDEDRSGLSWFRTKRGSGKLSDKRRDWRTPEGSDVSGVYDLQRDDRGSERTVIVDDDSYSRPRKRKFSDSFITWSGKKDRDVSGVEYLPKRSLLGSWLYVVLIVVGVAGIGVIVALVVSVTGNRSNQPNLPPNPVSPPVQVAEKPEEPPLPAVPEPVQPSAPAPPVSKPSVAPTAPPNTGAIEERFNAALREYRFFPPPDFENAWEILQEWKHNYVGSLPEGLSRAQQRYCRELERYGQDQLQRNLPKVSLLLDQKKKYDPESNCMSDLQADFDRKINDKRQELRELIERKQFVLPEQGNALNAALEIRSIIPGDREVSDALQRIWQEAIRDAQAKSSAHQHAEAKRIYEQLRGRFPDPPGGIAILDQGIAKQVVKLELQKELRDRSVSIPVKHPHGREIKTLFLKAGESTGTLTVNETEISYTSPNQPGDNFHILYEALNVPSWKGNSILLSTGKSEWRLEALDLNGQKVLADLPHRIEEIKRLAAEYNKP